MSKLVVFVVRCFVTVGAAITGFAAEAVALDLSLCNGNDMKRYIGKPVKDMQRVRTDAVRYVCEGCAMTMDYSAERLTVIYSEKTGRIVKMSCN